MILRRGENSARSLAMRLIITGRPGVGKSTLFNSIVCVLRESGYRIGGIIAPEVRERGLRLGFKVIDLISGEEAWLAKKGYESVVRVGSYGVVVDEADKLVKKALTTAIERADIIGLDEVGPMELKLPSFKPLLIRILDSRKPAILVVHFNLSDRDILLRLEKARKVVLTPENREHYRRVLPGEVLEAIKSAL